MNTKEIESSLHRLDPHSCKRMLFSLLARALVSPKIKLRQALAQEVADYQRFPQNAVKPDKL